MRQLVQLKIIASYWKILKGSVLKARNRSSGQAKDPRTKDDEKYPKAKRKASRVAFANIKYNGDLVPRDDHKYDVLSITKKMIKTYQDTMGGGGQYASNDCDVLTLSDQDKKIAWKNYHQKLS